MKLKPGLALLALLAVILLHGPAVGAIAECENIDPTSASDVHACIVNIPQFQNTMPQIADNLSGCQFARVYYSSGPVGAPLTTPACSVFAAALAEMNGEPPIWSACSTHFESGGDASGCLRSLIDAQRASGAGVTCADAQTAIRAVGMTIVDPAQAMSYEPPSCAVIDSFIEGTRVASAPVPAAPTPAPAATAPTTTSRPAAAANPPPAAVAGEPRNQLRAESLEQSQTALYFYRDALQRWNLEIRAEQDGSCAEIMSVSVNTFSRRDEYPFLSSATVHGDILDVLRNRCPAARAVNFTVSSQFGSAARNPQTSSRLFRAQSDSGWQVQPVQSVAENPDLADAIPFRVVLDDDASSTESQALRSLSRGLLNVRGGEYSVSGMFRIGSEEVPFEGTFEPFELDDPSIGQRAVYTITGDWYSTGDARSRCFKPKDGYAYWGTFTFTVDSTSSLRMETCPTTSSEYSTRAFGYRIMWREQPSLPNRSRELFARFDPPAGQFVAGDPVLVAARDDALRQAAIEAEKQRIKPGLAYKPLQYWWSAMGESGSPRGTDTPEATTVRTLKKIFDGVFDDIDYTAEDLRLIYYSYVTAYDSHCRDYIENPASRTLIIEETNEFGRTTRDEALPVYMENRFLNRFDEYAVWRRQWLASVMMSAASSGNIGRVLATSTGAANFHERVMDNVVSTMQCETPVMEQFTENLWRATHREPSLQDAGDTIAGAEAESEIPDYLGTR